MAFWMIAAVAAPGPAPACPTADQLRKVAVSSVFRAPSAPLQAGESAKAGPAGEADVVELRDAIGVRVEGLDILLQQEVCSGRQNSIVLFLDGRALPDLKPYPHADPIPYILLDVIPWPWLLTWVAVFLVLLVGVFMLGKKSDLLRESGAKPPGAEKAYSLSRVQLATWTFLVLASYLFIGLITGDYTTSITDSVLTLMGISVGTALGASIIDISPSRTQAGGADKITGRVAASSSGRWWLDILSDNEGVNLHRFQMAAWTLVLGIIFVQQVYRYLAMPEFAPSVLALMGISAGTYLGLKITAE
jgi:hypothetical protein